jgi:hypothetical protein
MRALILLGLFMVAVAAALAAEFQVLRHPVADPGDPMAQHLPLDPVRDLYGVTDRSPFPIPGDAGPGTAPLIFYEIREAPGLRLHREGQDIRLVFDDFVLEDLAIGRSWIHYNDPEFIHVNGQYKMLFTPLVYDPGPVWVADIDPVTGGLVSGDGLDLWVDDGIVPIHESLINGPEWSITTRGLAMFYTKYDARGRKQVWRAELRDPIVRTQMTHDSLNNISWAATQNPLDASAHLFLVRDYLLFGTVYWADENSINYENPVRGYVWPGNNGPRWVPGTPYFVYSKQLAPDQVELVRVDTRDGTERVVTNDRIVKVDTWGFPAPEFNNEICYSALISDTAIGVYRFLDPDDPFATLVATISLPEGDPHKYIRSIEILQMELDLVDATYFAFLGSDLPDPLDNAMKGSMWIASLGADPASRFVRRVDDGAVTGEETYRIEPELLIGQDEVFLYYNYYAAGGAIKELRRCGTGIRVDRSREDQAAADRKRVQ